MGSLFATVLVDWYRVNQRNLPWRETKDPYRIWISEIILQQTRVVQGHDYYCRFVQRFPDVKALAEADEDEVMRFWQGLGYYSRARNLHEAARSIIAGGEFPKTYESVRRLKGVGDYTAAAICSFAYGMPYAVVDGNVYRVLSRYLGVDVPVDTVAGRKTFAALAQSMLDTSSPALYNQAIMDFGALQCVPQSPSCGVCPLAETCCAFREGKVADLPRKQHKVKSRNRFFIYLYVRAGSFTFIRKREANDVWRNLYEFPLIETSAACLQEELLASQAFKSLFEGLDIEQVSLVKKQVKHVLSHQVIYADCYVVELADEKSLLSGYRCIPENELHNFPTSRLLSRFFSLILRPDS